MNQQNLKASLPMEVAHRLASGHISSNSYNNSGIAA
jgi:hypothetical protein